MLDVLKRCLSVFTGNRLIPLPTHRRPLSLAPKGPARRSPNNAAQTIFSASPRSLCQGTLRSLKNCVGTRLPDQQPAVPKVWDQFSIFCAGIALNRRGTVVAVRRTRYQQPLENPALPARQQPYLVSNQGISALPAPLPATLLARQQPPDTPHKAVCGLRYRGAKARNGWRRSFSLVWVLLVQFLHSISKGARDEAWKI